jgi:hypothetical protein
MSSRIVTLESTAARRGFLLLVGCALLVYSWQAAQPWRAARFATRLTERDLTKAASLQPWDATYASSLGRYYFFAQQRTPEALPYLKRATELNPGVGRYWVDLAAAYRVANSTSNERDALRRAAAAEPRNPEVLWETANYWLSQGETETALLQFRAILESDEYADAALQICWRATHDVNRVDALLNGSTARRAAFLSLLGNSRDLANARLEWERIATGPEAVETAFVAPYVEALISAHNLADATQVWRRTLELNGVADDYIKPDNLVENGGFEQPLLNVGFDWRRVSLPGVFVSLDSLAFHGGRQALFLQFENAQQTDFGVWQLVRVAPSTHYRFSAWVQTEELVGAPAPRIEIEDAVSAAPLFVSDPASGSDVWHELEGEFTTPAATHAVRVRLARASPSGGLDGRLWIDDVTITAE